MAKARDENPETIEALRQVLAYDRETGTFTWKRSVGGVKVGSVAGSTHAAGYIHIGFGGRVYYAHRVVWALVHGEWPPGIVDHKNRKKDDNRIENLRLATGSTNVVNAGVRADSTSGRRGVYWNIRKQLWHARVTSGGRRFHLGYFDNIEDAAKSAQEARERLFGEFAAAA